MSVMLSDFTGVLSLRRLSRGLMTVASGEHQGSDRELISRRGIADYTNMLEYTFE